LTQRAGTIIELVRARGPMTVAAFMDLALYHPSLGYYARAARRSGRTGDFFTSVDVGDAFGDLLERQIAEMADLLPGPVDLVEAGAGNGRLSADILRAARERHPLLYERIRLHLVETSPAARHAQAATLADVQDRLASSSPVLPDAFTGILFANELLDAMPVHHLVMRDEGLREVYVEAGTLGSGGRLELTTREGPLSTPALARYLERVGADLAPGWAADVSLLAVDWVRDAARSLRRGFVIFIDYGHEAHELFSAAHVSGSLTTFEGHRASASDEGGTAPWLERPGQQDMTAHVDFTTLRRTLEEEGLEILGIQDQTYFLLGLLDAEAMDVPTASIDHIKRRLALKTLLMPGGLGSTMKVLVAARGVGKPFLKGCSYRVRLT
jgi:SAM-dependent MidA family methyltransferase